MDGLPVGFILSGVGVIVLIVGGLWLDIKRKRERVGAYRFFFWAGFTLFTTVLLDGPKQKYQLSFCWAE